MVQQSDYQNILMSVNFVGGAGQDELATVSGETDQRSSIGTDSNGYYQFYYYALTNVSDLNTLGYYTSGVDREYTQLPTSGPSLSTNQQTILSSILSPSAWSVTFSDVAKIDFNAGTTSNADIVIGATTNGGSPSIGSTTGAYELDYSAGYDALKHGDVWLNNDFNIGGNVLWNDTSLGNYGHFVLQHELAHSLGLDHPSGALDSMQYTIMSTSLMSGMDALGTSNDVLPFGLQLLDIAALQEIYGRNYDTRSGDTTYSAATAFASNRPNDAFIYTIWDGDGEDTIDVSAYTNNQGAIIDLRQGEFSSVGFNAEGGAALNNLAIAYHAIIENAIGTSNGDILIGNAWNNDIQGGDGNDRIFGDGMTLEDDSVIDQIYDNYAGYGTGVGEHDSSNPESSPASDKSGADILDGGAGNDYLYGGTGKDTLIGGIGNDYLYGGHKSDTYRFDVGDGNDFVYEVWDSENSFIFDSAVDLNALSYERILNNLKIEYSQNDSITLVDFFVDQDGISEKIINSVSDIIHIKSERINVNIHGTYDNDVLFGSSTTGAAPDIIGYWGNDVIYGGYGNDNIYGDNKSNSQNYMDGNDRLYGGDGNDSISGGRGDDRLYGEDGDDSLGGGPGNDRLYGGNGDDTLGDGEGIDFLYGEAGSDTYYIRSSDEINQLLTVEDSSGNNDKLFYSNNYIKGLSSFILTPANGSDLLIRVDDYHIGAGPDVTDSVLVKNYFTSADTIEWLTFRFIHNGQYTNDQHLLATLTGGFVVGQEAVDDTLTGDASDNRLYGFSGNDTISGLAGNDTLIGGAGNDTLSGGDGSDTADYSGASAAVYISLSAGEADEGWDSSINDTLISIENVIGSAYGDFIYGSNSTNHLWGGAGNDEIRALDDDDFLYGGDDNDTLYGGYGDDYLEGGNGDDQLNGQGHDDTIYGQGGDDQLWGDTGNDTLYGGTGNDDLRGNEGMDELYGDAGDDDLYGGDGSDTLYGGDDGDRLYGDADNDILYGEAGNDLLRGDAGNDTLYGGSGVDDIRGGSGNDILVDSWDGDRDYIEGDGDADTFTFLWGGGGNYNIIGDFDSTIDGGTGKTIEAIDISDILDNTDWDGQASTLEDYVAFVDNGSHSVLRVDIDGTDSGASFASVARLNNEAGLLLEDVNLITA